MLVLRLLILCAVLAAMPLAVSAWDHRIERGLDLYQARGAGVALSLVCDPNRVYGGTTQTGLLVSLGGDVDATMPVTFRFPDGIAVQAAVIRGRIGKAETECGAWAALVDGFRTHGTVIMEAGEGVHDVDLGQPVMFTCT